MLETGALEGGMADGPRVAGRRMQERMNLL